jgi:hypothetical protein
MRNFGGKGKKHCQQFSEKEKEPLSIPFADLSELNSLFLIDESVG